MKLKTNILLFCMASWACAATLHAQNTTADPFDDFNQKVEAITNQITEVEIPERTINLIEYAGQAPDRAGTFDFRESIQNAIQELSAKGGGTLHFPHIAEPDAWVKLTMVYRIKGPIHLESNIELLIDHSVKLFFECAPEAYLPEGKGTLRRYEGTTLYSLSPLIYAFNKRNIRIRANKGNGALPEITGDGESWIHWSGQVKDAMETRGEAPYWDFIRAVNNADVPLRERHYTDLNRHPFRPTMMEFFHCEQVEVNGLKLSDSPFWVVHPVFSQNMAFRNIIFDAQNVNNDGFDPESSRNILIEDIIFNNHDDNVAIKAGRDKEGRDGVDISGTELEGLESDYIHNHRLGGPTEHIVFRNSTIQGHYALAIGSEMSGSVRNIYAYNCVAPIYVKTGLFIKSSRKRGGTVSDVYIRNFQINRTLLDAIALIPNYDGDTAAPYPPSFSNIYIENFRVNATENGLRLYGWPDAKTKDIYLKNVRFGEAAAPLQYNFVENIRLERVKINGQVYNNTLSRSEANESTPNQN
jgi:polygalacturonase